MLIPITNISFVDNINVLIIENREIDSEKELYSFYVIDDEGKRYVSYARLKRKNKIKTIKCDKDIYHRIKDDTDIYFYTKKCIDINSNKLFLRIKRI